MPTRLASKIILISPEDTKEKLSGILLNGEDDIPTFMGGTCDHEKYYPAEGAFPNKSLKFDYDGMRRRLEESIKAYHK